MAETKSECHTVAPPAPRPRKCLRCGRTFPSEGNHQRICRTCKRTRSLDDPEPEEQLDSEASRARRERGLRRLMGLTTRRGGITRFFLGRGRLFETCQWIDGEPCADDSCKCGSPVRSPSAYCDRHAARARLFPSAPALEAPRRHAQIPPTIDSIRPANSQPGVGVRNLRARPERRGRSGLGDSDSVGPSQ